MESNGGQDIAHLFLGIRLAIRDAQSTTRVAQSLTGTSLCLPKISVTLHAFGCISVAPVPWFLLFRVARLATRPPSSDIFADHFSFLGELQPAYLIHAARRAPALLPSTYSHHSTLCCAEGPHEDGRTNPRKKVRCAGIPCVPAAHESPFLALSLQRHALPCHALPCRRRDLPSSLGAVTMFLGSLVWSLVRLAKARLYFSSAGCARLG